MRVGHRTTPADGIRPTHHGMPLPPIPYTPTTTPPPIDELVDTARTYAAAASDKTAMPRARVAVLALDALLSRYEPNVGPTFHKNPRGPWRSRPPHYPSAARDAARARLLGPAPS